jgi:CRP-like cAMP-binding protein
MKSNAILQTLWERDPSWADVRTVRYAAGDCLVRAGSPIDSIIFPLDGLLVSTLTAEDGSEIEVGMHGRRSAIGSSVVFGATAHPTNCICQMTGSGWTVGVDAVIAAARKFNPVWVALARHEQFVLAQAQRCALCNAKHSLRQRFATKLLRLSDFRGARELQVTQDQLACWLGVQRTSISSISGKMQDRDVITIRRGRVFILNPDRLADDACSCYSTLRELERGIFDAVARRPADDALNT